MTSALIEARRLLADATPLKCDCGLLCRNACCKPDRDGQGGVALFPGEESENMAWGRVVKSELICLSVCDRSLRPLGCRIFPLTFAVKKDGTLGVGMDLRARAMCPLYRCGVKGLNAAFVENARRAVSIMAEDARLNRFMREWARRESQFRRDCAAFVGGRNARN